MNTQFILFGSIETIITLGMIIICFVHLIMRYIFNEYKNLHYHHLMINGVKKVLLKINQGTNTIEWL